MAMTYDWRRGESTPVPRSENPNSRAKNGDLIHVDEARCTSGCTGFPAVGSEDPELERVVDGWAGLPPHIRSVIITLVDTAQ